MMILIKILLSPILMPAMFILGFLISGDNKGMSKWSLGAALRGGFDAMLSLWEL